MYCLQSFCSICLNNTETIINLNNKDSDGIRLVDKLDFCIPGTHQLYNNQCFICLKCLQNLNTSYEFIILCKTNRTQYDDYLLKLSNNAVYTPQHKLKISLLDIRRCGLIEKLGSNYCNLEDNEETENPAEVEVLGELPLLEIKTQAPVLPPLLSYKLDHDYCSAETKTVEINNPEPSELTNKNLETKIVEDYTILPKIKQEVVDDPGKSQCPACQTYFNNRLQFIIHFKVRIVHINQEIFVRYKCCTCFKSFKNRKILRNHILSHRIDHNPATTYYQLPKKPENKIKNRTIYQCNVCSRQFRNKLLFEQHVQTHKIFNCKHCPKTFALRQNFSEHLKTHLAKNYSCKVSDENLQNKITITAKYTCKSCSRIFKTARGLMAHEIVHSRTYFCQFCNGKFRNKTNLENHKLTHGNKFSRELYHKVKLFKETNKLFRNPRPANVRTSPRRLATNGEVLIKTPPARPAKNISEDKEKLFKETNNLFRNPRPANVRTSPRRLATNGEVLIKNPPTGPAKNISVTEKAAKHTTPNNITMQNENTQTKTVSTKSFPKNELTENIPRIANQIRDKTKEFVIATDDIKTKETKGRNLQQVQFQIENQEVTVFSRTQSSPPGVESNEEKVPAKKVGCRFCKQLFDNTALLRAHFTSVVSGNETKIYNCCICQAVLNDRKMWEDHMRNHVKRNYSCSMCPAKFIWRSEYVTHVNDHELQKYQCSSCYYKFDSESSLSLHVRQKHSGIL